MAGRICIITCEHFVREIAAVIQKLGGDNLTLYALPAVCTAPFPDMEKIQRLIAEQRHKKQHIHFLMSGACLQSLQGSGDDAGEIFHPPRREQCFYFLVNRDLVDHYQRRRGYLLTPGWLAKWRDHLAGWGFDQKTAREYFREATDRLVLLDTGLAPEAAAQLQDLSAYLDLPGLTVPVGLEMLTLHIEKLVRRHQWQEERHDLQDSLHQAKRKLADYAMIYDLIGRITGIMAEEEVIATIMELFAMLFAPRQLFYLSIADGKVQAVHSLNGGDADLAKAAQTFADLPEGDVSHQAEDDFTIRINYSGETKGVVEVREIAFGEYRDHYLNLALTIAHVCGLAVTNARNFMKIKNMAEIDGLTGIYNRRHFFNLAVQEFDLSRRHEREMSAIMLDIDHFKLVNDRYGHMVGDEVLREATGRCRKGIRKTDILGRYGGEEFAVILPETNLVGAQKVAETLRQNIAAVPFATAAGDLQITISLGVAVRTGETTSLDALLNRADEALYQAKKSGRNRVAAN